MFVFQVLVDVDPGGHVDFFRRKGFVVRLAGQAVAVDGLFCLSVSIGVEQVKGEQKGQDDQDKHLLLFHLRLLERRYV